MGCSYSVLLDIVPFSLLVVLFITLYNYGTATYGFWKSLGVASVKPLYPFFGNFHEAAFSLKPNHEIYSSLYYVFKDKPFVGIYKLRKPRVLVRDPELVVAILIKDFGKFTNGYGPSDIDLEPLSGSLVTLNGEKWKGLRNKINPIFSSAKLKNMHQELVDCSRQLVEYMAKFAGEPFDVKEVTSRFGVDLISSLSFGINSDILNQTDSPFRKIGLKIFEASFISKFRQTIAQDYPWLARLFRWQRLPKEMEFFFMNVINETLEYREKNKIVRQDFLHLLNEMKKNDINNLQNGAATNRYGQVIMDDKLIMANCLSFFVSGLDSASSLVSFALLQLSFNQDIQEKLYNEIVTVLQTYNNELTYSATKEMTYMGQVLNETLRMYTSIILIRKADQSYKFPGSSVVIPKGTFVEIPIYCLHHDAEYFPEPDKFLPERFSEENKGNIKKGTFLPFSDGPRICIGLKLAKLMITVMLTKILQKYKINPSKKMKGSTKFCPKALFLKPVGGIWIELEKRRQI